MWKAKAILKNCNVINLNDRPIVGDINDAMNKADELIQNISNIDEIQYWKFACITCEHCQLEKWVPYHPLFRCGIGGKMDKRSTIVTECPETIFPID